MSLEVTADLRRGDFHLRARLDLPEQGVTTLFGPSGCGKTTLLRILAGLERHRAGRVRVGASVWQDADTWVPPHRRGAGMVFQKPALFPHRTVRGNLAYARKRVPANRRGIPEAEVVDILGLGPLLDRRPDTLSGGEAQRAAVARALVSAPGILLLDEPLSALDESAKGGILDYLEHLLPLLEIPVVYVTHALDEVARLADTVVVMDCGRIRTSGTAEDVLSDVRNGLGAHDHARAVVDGRVRESGNGLITVETPAGTWTLPGPPRSPGGSLRIRIAARDVSLALAEYPDTSFQNILPATVEHLEDVGRGQCLVTLNVRGHPLLARITTASATRLNLRPGTPVFAQIKSVALGEHPASELGSPPRIP